jgi:agmatine deiminase
MKKYIIFSFVAILLGEVPNFRVVAEWEPALGTMIRWPLGIPSELVIELAEDDILYVLVENINQENSARNNFNSWGIDMINVQFIYTETYSHWTRDHGPQFIIGEDYWRVVNQQFNGYPEESGCQEDFFFQANIHTETRPITYDLRGWEEDDDTNLDFADQMDWDIQNISLYLTGGNFMTDGYGMGFSTQLLVNENNISNSEFQQIVSDELFLSDYHIFDNPNVSSIQHIDCLAKLVNSETIIIKKVPESSPEYECIEDFAQSFYELNTFYNRPFKIHRIYCPEINGGWWEVNSVAAYTNSLILNNKVLVPQYDIIADINALNTYQEAMPGYEIIGFYNNTGSPWYGEDALHCRTMGIFDPNMIHISHKSIRTEEIDSNSSINVEVEIIDYNNSNVNLESVTLNWKYSLEDGPFTAVDLQFYSEDIYAGTFPDLMPSSSIEYYITATNLEGHTASNPNAGWHNFNTLQYILGDINTDGIINIQDIVLAVSLILASEYNDLADLNLDGIVDVLDIVQLINVILD